MIAVQNDDRVIPLADRVDRAIGGRRDEIVQRAGAVDAQLAVGMTVVIEHLVFEAFGGMSRRQLRGELFRHVVLHAAVARGADLPVPRQLEVAIRADGEEIAPLGGLAVCLHRHASARDLANRAIFNGPVPRGYAGKAEPAPPGQRNAIEQQLPSGASLIGAELVGRPGDRVIRAWRRRR